MADVLLSAQELLALRCHLHLSRREMARCLNLSEGTLRGYERGYVKRGTQRRPYPIPLHQAQRIIDFAEQQVIEHEAYRLRLAQLLAPLAS
jgi:DNA-binding CsgD family transcriptional regulator